MINQMLRFICATTLLLSLHHVKAQPCIGTGTLETTIENCTATVAPADQVPAIYPNPSHTTIWVRNPGEAASFKLFNSVGDLILEEKLEAGITAGFPVNQLPEGIYFVQINARTRVWTQVLRILKNP